MDDSSSVVTFAGQLKRRYGQSGVDSVALNAAVSSRASEAALKGEEESGILAHLNKEGNWPSRPLNPMYGLSKLLLEYSIREICRLALGFDGEYVHGTTTSGVGVIVVESR
ncbi:hypothetical protein DL766_002547 [Monosporascus sp. MC13-8B]|uniref:Beta-ketoacyl synthase N-terminal domain-containing protein n=1 Tax=Monosporascus cannonballus TaxID=155416 RepID=A0ABY0GRT7_9PEZI|nr:hypothetical protein DL762_009998 [Monosporascus cannonballus]RYP01052.1 hypothetical protein DL763_000473 [Monosporascus cannonballus]RYP35371.1 hypothetical protein DL766_002547 [Monosporascus sp. MC13-8B]